MANDLKLSTPLGEAKDPGPPPDPGIQAKPAEPLDLAAQYKRDIDAILPRFEKAQKDAQDSLAWRQSELRELKQRTLAAPGMPESPELPEAPQAPKIRARPFMESGPLEDSVTSLNKLMAGLGLMAQMAVGIKGGFPQGALAAYTGAIQGWQAGDQRRAANEYQTFLGELHQHDRDVASIRTKYDDAIRRWGADQDKLKTEMGILAAEHGLTREGIELAFKDPQRAFDTVNTIAGKLNEMQTSAANLAFTQLQWYEKKNMELMNFAQKERFHQEEMAAKKETARAAKLTDENSMRQQFLGQSKDFVTIRDSYARLSEAAKNPSAAGDLAMIFNYMKMLDPGSVVRESEFANAQNAAGVPERVRAQYNRVLTGERLSDVTRKDFFDQAGGQYKAQLSGQRQLETQFRGLAERAGMDPSQIVIDFAGGMRGPSGPPPTLPPGTKMEGNSIVSESGKFIWDGSRWQPR